MTVAELYENSVRPLCAADRLQLARLILNDIAPPLPVDISDEWSEEDLQDLAKASWQRVVDGAIDGD